MNICFFYFLLSTHCVIISALLRAGVEPATYGFLAFYIVSLQSTALPTELSKVVSSQSNIAIDSINMHQKIMVEIIEITELKESARGTKFRQI